VGEMSESHTEPEKPQKQNTTPKPREVSGGQSTTDEMAGRGWSWENAGVCREPGGGSQLGLIHMRRKSPSSPKTDRGKTYGRGKTRSK